jgi:transposase
MVGKKPEEMAESLAGASSQAMLEELLSLAKSQRDTILLQTESIEKQTRTIEQQTRTIEQLMHTIELKDDEIALLKRMVFGPKSEKFISVETEMRRRRKKDEKKAEEDKEKAKQKRKENAEAKKNLPTEEKEHKVREEDCCCPHCGGSIYTTLGHEESDEYEFVPAHFKRVVHRREKKVCTCKQHIVIAPAPDRVSEGVIYGPGMHAHVVVSKCLDSIPLNRLAKQFERVGIPMGRSTLCDMFHRVAVLLRPIYERIIEIIPAMAYVNADETRIKVQDEGKTREAYMWVFIAGPFVAYVFSPSRSGQTPSRILGDSKGVLQVDQYSGYNQVTTPDKRARAGCMGHVRRKFFEAKDKAPDLTHHVLGEILKLYEVEYDAAAADILGTDHHHTMRQVRSKPLLEDLKKHLEEQRPNHLPKGPVGKAISYFINNWSAISLFLKDPKIRLDNNISEGQLRLIALGRNNYLFVGHDVAGQNLAVLQTFVATCVANEVNPQEYLTDVIMRVQTHPQSRIDELLPHNWKPPPTETASTEN